MNTITKFIAEARTELMKVNWPTRQTVINLTLTVIGVSVVFALLISGIDYGFTQGIKFLTTLTPVESGSDVTATPVDLGIDDIEVGSEGGGIQVETEPIE